MADTPVETAEPTTADPRAEMLARLAKGRATAAANRAKKAAEEAAQGGKPRGRPRGFTGKGKQFLAEQQRLKVEATRAAEAARRPEVARAMREEEDGRAVLPPPSTTQPKATEWPMGLRMLPKHFNLMLKDFGFNSGEFSQTVERAEKGNASAVARLEPMKQAIMALMEHDTHERNITSAETGRIEIFDTETGKPIPDQMPAKGQKWETRKETRSRWGVNDTYDVYAARGKRPRPGHWLKVVSDWFYGLCAVLEFKPDIPNPPVDSKIPEGTIKRIHADHALSVDPSKNPARANSLEFIQQFLDGAQCQWDGQK